MKKHTTAILLTLALTAMTATTARAGHDASRIINETRPAHYAANGLYLSARQLESAALELYRNVATAYEYGRFNGSKKYAKKGRDRLKELYKSARDFNRHIQKDGPYIHKAQDDLARIVRKYQKAGKWIGCFGHHLESHHARLGRAIGKVNHLHRRLLNTHIVKEPIRHPPIRYGNDFDRDDLRPNRLNRHR